MTDPLDGADLEEAAAALRAEWRTDEEEWTRAAVERWRHERVLLDVIREHMHRGDTVALRLGAATFTGRIRAVGDDVVTLAAGDDRVDVRVDDTLPLVLDVVTRARAGGTRGDAPSTFRTRLLELEAQQRDVELGLVSGDVVQGCLVVGADHVIVDARVVARAAVAWVRCQRRS